MCKIFYFMNNTTQIFYGVLEDLAIRMVLKQHFTFYQNDFKYFIISSIVQFVNLCSTLAKRNYLETEAHDSVPLKCNCCQKVLLVIKHGSTMSQVI